MEDATIPDPFQLGDEEDEDEDSGPDAGAGAAENALSREDSSEEDDSPEDDAGEEDVPLETPDEAADDSLASSQDEEMEGSGAVSPAPPAPPPKEARPRSLTIALPGLLSPSLFLPIPDVSLKVIIITRSPI